MPCMCLLPKTLVFIDFFWKHIMAQSALNGSCLCGSVKFEITPPLAAFRYCHCTRCQKASGSAHAANAFVPAAQFKWTAGEALIKRFPLPGAQRFAVWFCPDCGTFIGDGDYDSCPECGSDWSDDGGDDDGADDDEWA